MTSDAVTAAAAGTWTLGDLTVNRIGFGAMRLPQTGRALPPTRSARPRQGDQGAPPGGRARRQPHRHGRVLLLPLRSANELINRALAPYPDDLVIVTKVGPGRDPSASGCPRPGRTSSRAGRGEPAPARPRPPGRGEPAHPAGTDSIAEHFGALAELRDAGLIRHLGSPT